MDILRKTIASLITLYQKTLSPDHGFFKGFYPYGFCRHTPTCSAYAKDAFLSHGVLRGGLLTMKRIVSCNPWLKLSDEKLQESVLRTSLQVECPGKRV